MVPGSKLTCSARAKRPYWVSPSLPHPLPVPAMILETAALVALVSVPAAAAMGAIGWGLPAGAGTAVSAR